MNTTRDRAAIGNNKVRMYPESISNASLDPNASVRQDTRFAIRVRYIKEYYLKGYIIHSHKDSQYRRNSALHPTISRPAARTLFFPPTPDSLLVEDPPPTAHEAADYVRHQLLLRSLLIPRRRDRLCVRAQLSQRRTFRRSDFAFQAASQATAAQKTRTLALEDPEARWHTEKLPVGLESL